LVIILLSVFDTRMTYLTFISFLYSCKIIIWIPRHALPTHPQDASNVLIDNEETRMQFIQMHEYA